MTRDEFLKKYGNGSSDENSDTGTRTADQKRKEKQGDVRTERLTESEARRASFLNQYGTQQAKPQPVRQRFDQEKYINMMRNVNSAPSRLTKDLSGMMGQDWKNTLQQTGQYSTASKQSYEEAQKREAQKERDYYAAVHALEIYQGFADPKSQIYNNVNYTQADRDRMLRNAERNLAEAEAEWEQAKQGTKDAYRNHYGYDEPTFGERAKNLGLGTLKKIGSLGASTGLAANLATGGKASELAAKWNAEAGQHFAVTTAGMGAKEKERLVHGREMEDAAAAAKGTADYAQAVAAGKQDYESRGGQWLETAGQYYGKAMNYAGQATDLALGNNLFGGIMKTVGDATDVSESRVQGAWTTEEKNNFYYLWQTNGEDAAKEYAEYVNEKHAQENIANETKAVQDWFTNGSNYKGEGLDKGSLAFYMGAMNSALNNADYQQKLLERFLYGRVKTPEHLSLADISNIGSSATQQKLNELGHISEDVPFFGGKGWGDLYGLGQSMAKSAVSAQMGDVGSVAYFGDVANQTYSEAIAKGATQDQALTMGAMAGAVEVLTEKYSVEGLLKNPKNIAMSIARQTFTEASEEFVSEVAGWFTEDLIMGENSDFNLAIRAYMNDGLSYEQAVKRAWNDRFVQAAWAAIGGGLSGGLSYGGKVGLSSLQNYGGDVQTLFDYAGQTQEGSAAQKYLDKFRQSYDKTGRLTQLQASRLQEYTMEALNKTDKPELVKSVSEQLKKSHPDWSEAKIAKRAEAIVESALQADLGMSNGETFRDREEQRIHDQLRDQMNGRTLNNGNWLDTKDLSRTKAETYATEQAKTRANESARTVETKNGEKGEVTRAVMTDDGMSLEVKTESGTKQYSQSDLKLSEGQKISLSVLSQILGNDAAAAYNGMSYGQIDFSDPLSVIRYANAWASVRDQLAGKSEAEMLKSPLREGLTDTQAIQAWKAGQNKTAEKTETREKAKRGEGRVGLNGAVLKQSDGTKIKLQGISNQEKVLKSKKYKVLKALCEAMHIDCVLFDSSKSEGKGKEANGMYLDGTIYLDWAAARGDRFSSTWFMFRTMSHELTHFIQQQAPAEYAELKQFVKDYLSEKMGKDYNDLVTEKMERERDGLNVMSRSYAEDEVVADACETMLRDSEYVQKMFEENRNVFDTISEWVHKFLRQIQASDIAAKELQPVIKEVRNLWDAGLRAAVEGTSAEEKTTAQVETKTETVAETATETVTEQEGEDAWAEFDRKMEAENAERQAQREAGRAEVEAANREAEQRREAFANSHEGRKAAAARAERERAERKAEIEKRQAEVDAAAEERRRKVREREALGRLSEGDQKIVESLGKDAEMQVDKNGDMEIAKSEDGKKIAFSVKTYEEGGKEKLIQALKENGHTKAEIDAVIENIEATGDFLEKLAQQYSDSHGYENLKRNLWAGITTNLKTGKQVISALVNNGDYPVNIDLQLICKKRVAYMRMLTRLIDDGVFEKVDFKGAAIADLNAILRDGGFETACLGCFVESRRLQLQAWAETIVEEWNDEVDKRKQNAGSFNFAQGGNKLSAEDILNLSMELESAGKKNDKGNLNLGKGGVKEKMGRLLDKVPSLAQHLTAADLLTPDGLKVLRSYDQNLFSLVKQRYGAASPKIVQDFNPYNGEMADLSFQFVKKMIGEGVTGSKKYTDQAKKELPRKKGESTAEYNRRVDTLAVRKYLYDIGGARIQSFSDFMIENVFDYMQIVADLAARELPLHGYSKEAVFLRLFGMTGGKFNGSLIAHVEGKMGKEYAGLLPVEEASNGRGLVVEVDGKKYAICFDDYARNVATGSFIQSIGLKDIVALQLDPRYSKNVGSITIGVSDKQILAMLDSPYFRMVIPYHASGMIPEFAQLVGVDNYNDYTKYQTTKVKGIRLRGNGEVRLEYNEKTGKQKVLNAADKELKVDTHFDFNEAVQRLGDARAAADEYLAWCADEKKHPVYDDKKIVGYATLAPKFSDSPYGTDFTTHENYYKLLEDFNSYDSIGEASALQGPVTMTLPSEANRLTPEQMDAYKQALRDTGLFTEKEIEKYAKKADMTFHELIQEEIGNRAEYESKQAKVWDETVDKAESMLLDKYGRPQMSTKQTERQEQDAIQESHGDEGQPTQGRVQFSRRVTDPSTLKFLNDQLKKGEVIHTYKTFLEVTENGKTMLLPPMAAKQRGEDGKLRWANAMALNEWEESVGNPNSKGIISKVNNKGETKWYYRLVKDNGKTVDAAYDPYQHSSDVVLNDQFEEAYQRPNLVTYECVIPKSELTSGYHYRQARADGQVVEAALPVGKHPWKKGTVAGKLKNTDRGVYLTRWLMPVRRVSNSEVAQMYKEILDREDSPVAIPFNVVPPGLLTELEKAGVEIDRNGSPGYQYRANKKAASEGGRVQFSLKTGQLSVRSDSKTDRELLRDFYDRIVAQEQAKAKHNEDLLKKAHEQTYNMKQQTIERLHAEQKKALEDFHKAVDRYEAKERAVTQALHELDRLVQAGDDPEAIKAARAKVSAKEAQLASAVDNLTKSQQDSEIQKILQQERRIERQRTRDRIRESANRRDLRGKIDRLWKDLNRRITSPTEKKHIPAEVMQQAIDVLEALNMDTSREESMAGERLRSKLLELKQRYEALKNDKDYSMAARYDEFVSEMLGNMIEKVGDTPINKMSADQMEIVYETLKALDHVIKNKTKIQLGERMAEIREVGQKMIDETRSIDKAKKGWLQAYLNTQLSPERMFNRLGGYHKNSVWNQLYRMLDSGQLKQTQLEMEGSLIFDDLINSKEHARDYKDFVDPSRTVDVGLKDRSGNAVKLTHGMMVSLWMHLQNEQNRRHVAYGGLTIPGLKDYYGGKKAAAAESGVRVGGVLQQIDEINRQIEQEEDPDKILELEEKRDTISEDFTQEMLDAIEKNLTDYDRQWIAACREMFDGFSKRVLNETTMNVYGIKRANVENYFPLSVDKHFLQANFDTIVRDFNLENAGFMKERVESRKPVHLFDVSDVAAQQVRRVSQYAGLMPAIRAFNQVLGYTSQSMDSVQSAIFDKFGNSGMDYIENLMADLNGARGQKETGLGAFLNRLRGHMAQSALTLSLRTAMAQAASYPTAASVVGWKALHKALWHGGRNGWLLSKADKDLIQKWSPLLYYRMKGYSSVALGDIAGMNDRWSRVWKKARWLTGWIQAMDGATVGRLWYAAEFYVQDKNKDLKKGTDAYYEEVAKVFNDIVEKTQPNYTTMQRPDILRNPNALVKQLTMFMTQRLQNFNIMVDAAATYSTMKADFKAGRNGVTLEDVRQAGIQSRRAFVSQALAAMTIVAFKALADIIQHSLHAYRDDDDDELKAESISLELLDMFIDTLAGNVLGGGEAWDIAERLIPIFNKNYYGIEVSGIGAVNDFTDSLINLYSKAVKDDGKPEWKDYDKVIKNLCTLAGIPWSNGEKFVKAGWYWIQDAKNGELFRFEAGVDRTMAQQATRLYRAYTETDGAKVKKVLSEVPEDKQKDLYAAVRKVIKTRQENGEITVYESMRQMQKYGNASQQTMQNYIKDLYEKGLLPKNDAIKYLQEYGGRSAESAEKTIREMSAEIDTGVAYSDLSEQYMMGEISAEQAVKMLQDYGGKDAATAKTQVEYWDFQKQHPTSGLDFSEYKTYANKFKPIGLTPEQYEDYAARMKDCKGVDANGDGKTDSGSKKAQVIKLIDSMNLTPYQKDQMYLANNYAESGLIDCPWH